MQNFIKLFSFLFARLVLKLGFLGSGKICRKGLMSFRNFKYKNNVQKCYKWHLSFILGIQHFSLYNFMYITKLEKKKIRIV